MIVIAHIWQSTLFAAAVALAALLMRRHEARARYALWLMASIKFMVPISILTLAGSAIGAWTLPLAATPGMGAAARWLERSRPFWTLDATSSGAALLTLSTSTVVLGIWLGGAVCLLAWRVREWRRMARALRQAVPMSEGREAAALRAVARRAGVDRVLLHRIGGNQEPAVVGVRHAAILWPEGLAARLTDDELDAVLAHELCHVTRRDNLSSLIHVAVEILFWFHPMVWWLSGRLVHERERACDEEVVHMGSDKAHYAAGILKVCGFCLRAPAAFAAGIGSSDLVQRIERILGGPSPRVPAARIVAPALAALMVALPLAAGILNAHGRPTQEATAYKPGNGVTAPKLLKEAKPKYTASAMREKIQGTILLSAIVLADGNVGDVKVTRSLDKVHGLDDEAVATLKKWKFEPGRKDGKPVPVRVDVEMSFALKK